MSLELSFLLKCGSCFSWHIKVYVSCITDQYYNVLFIASRIEGIVKGGRRTKTSCNA